MKVQVVLVFFIWMQGASCLKLLRVLVPQIAMRGESAILQCQYELQGDALYSVKWYKDNEEFFRFVPRASPALHSYRLEGVKVDHHKSDSKKVFLRSVTLKTSGVYRCEVSAEAPSFSSVQGEGTISVVYLPKDGPHITGEQTQYEIGEEINLNCTSGRSHPPSNLQWYINEKQVLRPELLVPYPHLVHQGGLITTTLGLHLRVGAEHFVGGSMRVRCVASLSPVAEHLMWQDDDKGPDHVMPVGRSPVETNQLVLDNREALLLVRSSANQQINGFTLLITLLNLILLLY